ncbi:hypothetical protein Glove_132g167 [Diversispora epigaea]|uniref:Uncharacterized protein n=1 Tax=Diversispora epigaea TaxID=1348612 RepID=A0A397J6N3_9GLOM|nr:hypothetical protein Glove_132g167 [Diversispora epigaea]
MPCCVDTIVKIKQVCITDKKETNLTVIWAIGTYLVEVEDCNMEMVLFVPFDKFERDFNMQYIFRKDKYYSVGRKITPGSYTGRMNKNRNPINGANMHKSDILFCYNDNLRLKMIVATSTHLAIKKEPGLNRYTAKEINTENAMIKALVKDYIGQKSNNFIVKCYNDNLRLKMIVATSTHLAIKKEPGLNRYTAKEINTENAMIKALVKDYIGQKRQMEVIQKDFYIYAIETSYVDVSTNKKEVYNSSQSASESHKSVRSTLLINHQDINSYMFKYNKKYVDEDDELEENVVNRNEKNKHNSKKVENIIHKGEHIIEYNKKYTDKGNNLGEKVVNQNKNNEHNYEKMKNKIHKHIDSYIVEDVEHNKEYTGESSEPGKNTINQNERKEYNCV